MIREFVVKYKPSPVPLPARCRFSNSRDIFTAFKDVMNTFPVEVFRVIILDSKNQLICFEDISRGSISTSVVHPREAFWSAVYHRAAAVIFLHNHPSGDPAPSREDRECTNRLCRTGKILGIRVLDHVVIGFEDYFSFADAGLMEVGDGIP